MSLQPLHSLSKLKLFLACSLLSLLVGCGFALRGNIEIPEEAQSLWLVIKDGNSDSLRRSFSKLVEQNNLTLDEFADNQVIVNRVSFRRITTTLTSDSDVDEYTLRGELDFDIVNKDGDIIAKGLEGFAERTFEYDANDAAAANSREAFLNNEIWQNLSQQILRQYAAYFRLR